jgi:hypothetical protein
MNYQIGCKFFSSWSRYHFVLLAPGILMLSLMLPIWLYAFFFRLNF